jgi:hypothetical protein
VTASVFGPRTQKECGAWARTFALEPHLVEKAVAGYVAILESSASDPPSDAEIAKTLAQLRKDVGRIIRSDDDAPERAKELESIATRLDRAMGHAELIAASGVDGVPDLRGRLAAARSLVAAVRAALARRARAHD